jgi:hypothetical protein
LKYLLSKQKANNFNSLYGYYLGYDESMYENHIKKYLKNELIDDNLIIVNSEGDTHIEEKVSIKELAFVLNETREVLIGNNLVKYDYDYFESTDLLTNKTERKQIRKIFGSNNRKGKVSATNIKSSEYRHNGSIYKIEVRDNSYSHCSNANIGNYRSRHFKRFMGIFFSNSTNFVAVYGNNQMGSVVQYFTDNCVICSNNTQNNSVNVSCMGCSTAEWQAGPCYSNHNSV